jgi:hypothetical protein
MITVNNTCNRVSNVKPYTEVIPWKEQFEIHASEETWLDKCLETYDNGEGGGARTMARLATPILNPQRQVNNPTVKRAADQNWNRQMSEIQNHVSGVLGQLGNGRR